jgi:TonB-linked SusC/RagA family outer membrane protein
MKDMRKKRGIRSSWPVLIGLFSFLLMTHSAVAEIGNRNVIAKTGNGFSDISEQTGQQKKSVSGKVTNASGVTLPGVSVVVKGTTYGVNTDSNGNFSLTNTPENAILKFSFIGMKTQEIAVNNRTSINVVLAEETIGVEEVVVTALGIGRQKKALGYSVQDVNNEQLAEVKPLNAVNALSGKVAGVQITNATGAVGGASRIVIRGESSFTNSQPLWVVDGTPFINFDSDKGPMDGADFGNGALDIDPGNIESISVLKGANAAALYGSRGANGVILVTTKRGLKSKGFGVEVSSSLTVDAFPYLPYYQNKYGGGANGSEFDWKKYNVDNKTNLSYQDYSLLRGYKYVNGSSGVNDGTPSSWGPRLDIGLMLPQFDSPLDANGQRTATPWISHPNNVSDFYETGVTTDNSVSFSKAGDMGSMRAYFNDNRVKGTLPNTDYRKNTFGFNSDMKLHERLKLSSNITYVINASDNLPSQGYYGDAPNSPQSGVTFMPRQVDIKPLKENWNTLMPSGMPYNFGAGETPNPYLQAHNTNSRERNRLFGNVSLDLKLADWLTLRGRAGTDYYYENRKTISLALTYRATDGSGLNGTFNESNIMGLESNFDLLAMFDKKFGDIRIDGTMGGNLMRARTDIKTISANDLTVPDFFTIGNAKGVQGVSQFESKKETHSVFGSFNASYKNYLFLAVTARNDWSSTLPPDEWSYFYPSFSLGFVFTDAFKIDSQILSYGKLRAGRAKVGRDTSPYMLQPTFQAVGGLWKGNGIYSLPGTLPNEALKPEESISTEIGAEFKFFQNRLGLDISYYNARNVNQILNVSVPSASGYSAVMINAGEIQNKGIEIILNATPLKTKYFSWNVDLNYAKNKNIVNELYADLETYRMSAMWASSIEARPGQSYGTIIGTAYRRDANGNILVTAAGRLLRDANKEVGNITPDWVGGITNTFRYKNFSLRVLIDAKIGGDFVAGTMRWGSSALKFSAEGNLREEGRIWDAIKPDGKVNDIRIAPSAWVGDFAGTVQNWVMDGSYIKLREVSLGCNLPQKNLGKVGNYINSIRFSLIGRNLAILYRSNIYGIDPEVGSGSGIAGLGYEQMTVPACRNIGGRITFSF